MEKRLYLSYKVWDENKTKGFLRLSVKYFMLRLTHILSIKTFLSALLYVCSAFADSKRF